MRRLYQRISGSNIWLFLCFLFFFFFFFIFFFYKPERVLLLACSNNVCLDASVDNVQSWAHEFHGMVWQSSRSIVSFTEFV